MPSAEKSHPGPRRKRRTLGDVAAVAKVSEMTVSRVLSGKGKVSRKTSARVMRVVHRLGYVPNRLAGSLATSRSNQVAVVIPSLINNVFSEVTAGIADQLEKAGYNAVIGISEYRHDKEESLIRSMMSWRPAGLIVAGLSHTERATNIMRNASVPVVEIMELSEKPVDICIGLHHRKAGRMLGAFVAERGYRRFGYVGPKRSLPAGNGRAIGDAAMDIAAAKRLRGIEDALQAVGLRVEDRVLEPHVPDMTMGKAGLARLLARSPHLDAVFFSNDTAAMGGQAYCLEVGIDVPGQLALAGFSGLSSGQIMPRKLTTVATRRYDTGRLAARAVINRLEGNPVTAILDMGFELIEGETC